MGNQKKTTLRRQIKEDGLGFYLNFGPERLRPFRPKRTKFNLDGWGLYDSNKILLSRWEQSFLR